MEGSPKGCYIIEKDQFQPASLGPLDAPRNPRIPLLSSICSCRRPLCLDFHARQPVCSKSGRIEGVDLACVRGENAILQPTVGGPQRGESELLLQIFRHLQATQSLNLPLRRTVPDRIGAPKHPLLSHPLDQSPENACTVARGTYCGHGENRAEFGVDIVDAVLVRNAGQIADPGDLAFFLKGSELFGGGQTDAADCRMID